MVAISTLPSRAPQALDTVAQDQFVQMLPTIQRVASFAFRKYRPVQRQELMAEVIARALVMFSRLAARGASNVAYGTPLGWFAVRQALDGRRVGNRLNIDDVTSDYCRRHRGVQIQPLKEFDSAKGKWQELLVEDRRASPCDLAVTRLDFAAWLRQLPGIKREVAKVLATGERTEAAAKLFQVSRARVSQLRRELQASWEEFQGQVAPAAA